MYFQTENLVCLVAVPFCVTTLCQSVLLVVLEGTCAGVSLDSTIVMVTVALAEYVQAVSICNWYFVTL